MSVNNENNETFNNRENEKSPSSETYLNSQADDTGGTTPAKEKKKSSEIVEWTKALLIAVVLVVVIRQFLFTPYIVDGDSMQPNFETGERLIVNKLVYQFGKPKFGDVIVFNVPEDNRKFIKRVIGVPGDKIELLGDDLYINGQIVEEPYIKEVIASKHEAGMLYNGNGDMYNFPNARNSEIEVPDGMIFALGDNRGDSRDSRALGFIDTKEIIGRAELIFWPIKEVKFINHY